ncbi:Hydantoinase B/oxoprolinase-domain-containing protein [Talaromyces proteolyticus]|uniref:Hydantoinase B/oxoprolinase-domain-containing protein n=1 Tax=Talaromyces proteolyticus TaxID=1131652 RepID=A0AAD4KKE9_9EURO|nr:Hydantoinase B/oxoprolinase-domain-containing protein [Talaromyces proteolyticus]KAH8693568.1 Hydantoinase B/oxoprolinase-domain-containing protein [Talaromyces proteolyticus]
MTAVNEGGIRIAIGRGTFCDVIAQVPHREDLVFKLLSVDPQNYRDAPTEAIRRVLQVTEGRQIPSDEKLDASTIESCRIGTTIATNALLEQKGERFALLTTKGFKDLCEIGDGSRPKLFDLNIRKPQVLFEHVVEIDERVTVENYELNPFPHPAFDDTDPALVKTSSGEIIRILQPLDIHSIRQQLQALRSAGLTSLAVCFMHSHIFPDHEQVVGDLARQEGFNSVSLSSEVIPRIKMLQRATAVCTDAYLSPIVHGYVKNFLDGFRSPPQRIEFMSSDGGLRQAQKYTGNAALISGPAGGVVGVARSCYDLDDPRALIGFDMGGTSTDVCRYDGKFDHISESTISERRIFTPMLNVNTVAAGGGSKLFVNNGLLVVGPESASAHPGPACYRKGGPLTITDANLFLGRLVVSSFPAIFGKNANETLDVDVVAEKFEKLTAAVNAESAVTFTPEQVALGFIKVANESMCRPIRNATEARGFATHDHNLVSFGGAGGQHACAIASNLGIRRILVHRFSSLLSAYGISLAEITSEASESLSLTLEREKIIKEKLTQDLRSQDVVGDTIEFEVFLNLQYKGMDTSLSVEEPSNGDYSAAFTALHLREFAFTTNRDLVVDSIRVRATAKTVGGKDGQSVSRELEYVKGIRNVAEAKLHQNVFIDGEWRLTPVYDLETLKIGTHITGPSMITDKTQTILIEPNYECHLTSRHLIIDKLVDDEMTSSEINAETINPVQLSCFANRFMSIAEQMGNTLQRTSISTSIKERLDFSCAIFSPDGDLVANAPHIPIHLGSMQFAIQYQHRLWGATLKPGDVLLTNHPEAGGTHLPDLTVVTPAFYNNELIFYVASRGHHTDIGGIGITSMIPDSKELWQEGMAVKSMKIVSEGAFLEDEVRELFNKVTEYPGCSATRRLGDNISDIKAKISANQRGILLIKRLCEEFTLPVVHLYMRGIQENAELAIRKLFRNLYKNTGGKPLQAEDWFDDGTRVKVKITIDGENGTAVFDFAGTGAQTYGNMNMPISITHSAIIYVLRCMVDMDIPLNQGCLNPCEIVVPKGSILNPSSTVAICGSTISSQRVTDVLLQAFSAAAGSQGCANSLGWGMGGKDPLTGEVTPGWNYGETVGGGSGAGPTWHGTHGVNVHSTNTRATDPEVIEKRTPVIVRRDAINHGTGGRGRYSGGNGMTREIEARIPMKFSILSERRVYSPYGLEGGEPGSVGENFIFKKNEQGEMEKINIGAKAVVGLNAGDYIQINSPGGGGWGKYAKETLDEVSRGVRPVPSSR